MSGHARQVVIVQKADDVRVERNAEDHFDSDHKQTSLHNGNQDAEIHPENDNGWMSQLGQPTELGNGNEPRGCRIPPCAAGRTESNSNSDEKQQKQLIQLPNGREPRRWITKTEWTRYIQEDPRRNRRPSDVSIFRVPKFLKDTQREAYVPRRVALGPYHHGSAELPSMGHHKGRALRRMMKRFNENNKNLPVDPNDMDFANLAMQEILKLEKEIRDIYEENIDCNGETLARMLCLDGFFLLEVLITLALHEKGDKCYDPIFGERKLSYAAKDVLMDIWLLENQIPFIVLLKLLQLTLNSGVDNAHVKFLDVLAVIIASCGIPFDNKNLDIKQGSRGRHLLDFLHAAIVSPLSEEQRVDEGCNISIGCCSRQCSTRLQCKSKKRNDTERIASRLSEEQRVDEGCNISIGCCIWQCSTRLQCKSKERNDVYRIPHAVELRNAGIKFSALQEGCIKQIKFDENSATIFLPPISIMDPTERIFRNLIAYEMCKPSEINYVSSYAALMNDLIDTEQDVALMRRMGVLKNWLGSDKEVADLFNGLGKEVTVSMGAVVFDNLAEKVNAHYNNEIKVQIGKLVQDHFSSPWRALALTAASVILVLTVLQTIYTIISTYK